MRNVILLFLLLCTVRSYCQEKTLKPKIVSKPQDPATVITRTLASINSIRNAEYIWKEEFTLPYMPTVFHEPFISRAVVTMNKADAVQGAKLKYYLLEDTFRLQTVYDGQYIGRVFDDGKTYIGDISNSPQGARGLIGSFHLRVKTWLEYALRENAEIKITETDDSLKIAIAFHNQQLEFGAGGGTLSRKDTVGFVSRYTIYVDKHTYFPVKAMRLMSYNTSIETILYQRINALDTLSISVHDALKGDSLKKDEPMPDRVLARRLQDTRVPDWKLQEVEGDSIRFSDLKGRKCLMVFNTVGWKPCVQAIPFLNQLRDEYTENDLALVSIEPFIGHAGALKEYKHKHVMNYPLLLADPAMKKHYAVAEVPAFMIVDRSGVIREVITGFSGKGTEAEIRVAIGKY